MLVTLLFVNAQMQAKMDYIKNLNQNSNFDLLKSGKPLKTSRIAASHNITLQ